ncbi:phage tail protein, partial [Brevundimonas naejangsanensis]|uniref:phage tail protein n=1 Tax=Brevundimonas naejangsanensis TaxID=588932 RepID=UPI0026EFE1AE
MAEMAAAAWAFVKAAFVAVGSGTATAGQVATVVAVNVAGSVALSTAASVLMKPDVGGRAPGEWLADPNAGIPFAIGDRIGVAGNIVYKNTFGKDNEYKGIVTVLSGAGPISAYLGFTADREPIAFAGEAATGRYGGEMWMQRRLGEQPDTALTSPAAITYQALPNWGPNHRLSGKAAFMWTLRMDSKFSVYPQGEPAPITVLRGIKGYDHRYDSTMPGGSGPCRLNDRTTYRTITNPAIADLNWCLGLRENGKVVGGLGVSPAGIDWSAYTRAANVADANAWTLAAYPRSDESKSEVRAGMLQAAGAVISRRAGLVSCVTRGAPKSPVMTISAADTAGPIELDTAANVLNRYNTMTPRYLSEAHEWQLAPSAPVSSSVYVEEDRGRVRSDQRDYPYVPNAKQAAELCALDIAHSREGIAGRWPLKAYCRELEPGDVFTVNEPGLLLDGMDMLVLDRDYDPETDTPYVVFVSETPGKVAWALGQQANPSPTPALSARHDLNAPDPGAFDVVIVPPSPEGVSAPGAEVVIDIDNVRAEDLVIEIGPSFDGPWRVAKTVTINDGQLRIPVNELSPGEVFWVALSYRSADDGASPKTIKGPYTAGDLVAGDTTH